MKTYLVTGGCGFIGSHLCQSLLSKGHNVRIIDNLSTGTISDSLQGCEIILGNIFDRKLLENSMQDIDACFHLAGISSQENLGININDTAISGMKNILYTAQENKFRNAIPVVYTSSAIVYGDNANIELNEEDVVRPTNGYSVDNICNELYARIANIQYHIPTTGLRLFNVYGPGQHSHSPYSRVISNIIDHIINKTPIQIEGDGQQQEEFIFVNDVVNALICAMNKIQSGNKIYNVCSGIATSENQILNILQSISGQSLPVIYKLNETHKVTISTGNNAQFRKDITSTSFTNITEGLKLTYQSLLQKKPSDLLSYSNGVYS